MTTITIADETISGGEARAFSLDLLDEVVTVREIIRARVYQEVSEYNARALGEFHGLIQPRGSERAGRGWRQREPRAIDWQEQFRQAVKGFQGNGFLILVDDRQVTDLDERIELRHDTRVTFLRLVPLVGG